MNDTIVRYQHNPTLTDTVGFFDACIPLTNEACLPLADSSLKYYDQNAFNYITPTEEPKELLQTTSIYTPHKLVTKNASPQAINKQPTDWITLVLLLCVVIFTWIQSLYPKRLLQILRAVAQPHFVNQLEREGNLFKERIRLGLGFIYFSCCSIFIFLSASEFGFDFSGIRSYTFTGIVLGSLLLFEATKSIAVYLAGKIFANRENARQYQLNTMIFNHITGIVLLPIVAITFYWNSRVFIIVGIILISLLIFYRTYRGFLTGISGSRYNLFYLFLYLCTLEILPLLLLANALRLTQISGNIL